METSHSGSGIKAIISWIVVGAALLFLIFRAVRKSDSPGSLLIRWAITLPIVAFLIWKVGPWLEEGGLGSLFGFVVMLAAALALMVVWRHSIAGVVANPVGSLYDGGRDEVEARPYYSVAQGLRKRGRYTDAIAEARKQLTLFPTDFDGQLLIAEIQAENMNDVAGAEVTINHLLEQPGHPPRSIAYALNSLADWHLKFSKDPEAARRQLARVRVLLPNSEMAALAAQRIAHLADTDFLLSADDRKPLVMTPGVENVGLLAPGEQPRAPEVDPAKLCEIYTKHLDAHPLDTEVREKLAMIYADHYGRPDLAANQLQQLIECPNQPAKRVVHWLNLLADLQIKHGCDYEAVRATLQRIIDLYPNAASAQIAQNRMDILKLELKGKEKVRSVKLGTYEQDIGLKTKPSRG